MTSQRKAWRAYLLATACTFAIAGSAAAADLPIKGAPMAVAAPSWTGFYFGGHVGVGSSSSTCNNEFAPATTYGCNAYGTYYGSSTATAKNTAFLGGIQGGYDMQVSRSFVWGVAADWTWTNLKGKAVGGSGSLSYEARIDWLASFRGRAGLSFEDTLAYFTGGLALGGVKDTTLVGTTSNFRETSKTQAGWVAGFGVEHRFSRNWSAFGEYLHYDLGTYSSSGPDVSGTFQNHTFSHTVDVARVGINYRP